MEFKGKTRTSPPVPLGFRPGTASPGDLQSIRALRLLNPRRQWSQVVPGPSTMFLVGGGPSLAQVPPPLAERMRDRALCVNNSWRVVRGRWWVGGDRPSCFPDELWNHGGTQKWTSAAHSGVRVAGRLLRERPCVQFFVRGDIFEHGRFWDDKAWQWGPSERKKDSLGIQGTRSSFLLALRLLKEMRVRRVFLVGVDFDTSRGLIYGTGCDVDPKHARRLQMGFEVTRSRLRSLLGSLPYQIVNCSPGSRLDLFPYQDLSKALTEIEGEQEPTLGARNEVSSVPE